MGAAGARLTDAFATPGCRQRRWPWSGRDPLPPGAAVTRVTLDGIASACRTLQTARGVELVLDVPRGVGTARLVVGLA